MSDALKWLEKLRAIKLIHPDARYICMSAPYHVEGYGRWPGLAKIHRGKPVKTTHNKGWADNSTFICHAFGLNDYAKDWRTSLVDIDRELAKAQADTTAEREK